MCGGTKGWFFHEVALYIGVNSFHLHCHYAVSHTEGRRFGVRSKSIMVLQNVGDIDAFPCTLWDWFLVSVENEVEIS